MIDTLRLVMRDLTHDDYNALYAVLADLDIMQYYPYTHSVVRRIDESILVRFQIKERNAL